MAKEEMKEEIKNKKSMNKSNGASGAVYGLGFIGALVYFIQHAANFSQGILGFFKTMVWPALLIYKFLEFFKM